MNNIYQEIIRELYRLVREEGYAPDLSGIDCILLSPQGYNELRANREYPFYLSDTDKPMPKFMGIQTRWRGRQEEKFRVICQPTDD